MMQLAAQWVRSLIFAAAFCMLVLAVTPEGTTKQAMRFVCSLVCISFLLGAVTGIDFERYSEEMSKYSVEAQRLSGTALDEKEKLNRLYIEDECRAYILDKAKELGADIDDASVEVKWSTDGFWYPVSAAISGSWSEEQKKELERLIEAVLGIPGAEQRWEVSAVE